MTNWKDVWASRSGPAESLADLIALDGFDTGAGKAREGDWQKYVAEVSDEIGIVAGASSGGGDSVIELGCGAGAFLYALANSKEGLGIAGVDYSSRLLAVAQEFLPQGLFELSDLRSFEFKREYNHVIIHSVIQYLSEDEAKRLVSLSLNSAKNTVSVLEVPHKEKRKEAERERRKLLDSDSYARRYSGLEHTYFGEDFFGSLLTPGWSLRQTKSHMENYAQAQFRFGVIYERQSWKQRG